MQETLKVSVRGRPQCLPAIEVQGATVVVAGRLVKKAHVFDSFWLERERLPSAQALIEALRSQESCPDLLLFTQRVPEVEPQYPYAHEVENYAVLPLTSYDHWFQAQISVNSRRNIRASEKRGVRVKVCAYDDTYVAGISSIYNESPVRAGRSFWHYGKPIDAVRDENGTYATRSTFLAAYIGEQMVGYMKVVWDRKTAAVMQILSKMSARDSRPNNALIAEAVRQACARGIEYLVYEKFDYGNKVGDSLTKFKQSNGFVRMDIPRYCVPLTAKGEIAVRLGLHRNVKERIPESVASVLRELRTKWHESRAAKATLSSALR